MIFGMQNVVEPKFICVDADLDLISNQILIIFVYFCKRYVRDDKSVIEFLELII